MYTQENWRRRRRTGLTLAFANIALAGALAIAVRPGVSGGRVVTQPSTHENLVLCEGLDAKTSCTARLASSTYNGWSAAHYADGYWLNYSPDWPSYNEDCTNFVSQALYVGGLPMTHYGSYINQPFNWWAETNAHGGRAIQTWTVSDDLFWYLHNASNGAAIWVGHWYGEQGAPWGQPWVPSSDSLGDPIFYDWTSDGYYDHATLYVGDATTASVIDQHTPDRYHSYWSGWNYNQYRYTTTYGFIHMT